MSRTDLLEYGRTVHLLFLDESGQLSERRLFALGGIALRDSDWHALRGLWQATLAAHGWPADREVKWHGIRTGEVPPALADAVVSALAHAPLTCYVTLLDQELGLEAAPELFATEEDTYATGLMFLAERFQHLLAAEDDVGLIVVDSRFREEDSRLRRFFSDLTKDGTPYSDSSAPAPRPIRDRAVEDTLDDDRRRRLRLLDPVEHAVAAEPRE